MMSPMDSSPNKITAAIRTTSAFKPYHAKQRLEVEYFMQKIQELANEKMENFAREYELAEQVLESSMTKRDSKRPTQSSSASQDLLAKQLDDESKMRKRESKSPMQSSSSENELAKQVVESNKRSKRRPNELNKQVNKSKKRKIEPNFNKKMLIKQEIKKLQKEIEKRLASNPPITNEVTERLNERIINDLDGSDVKLVIQKLLYSSDTRQNQNRLSMPLNQLIKTSRFLTPEEKTSLDNKDEFDVAIVGPTLQMYEKPMKLMMWAMTKTKSYVLKTNWFRFVEDNAEELEENAVIQVWSFRKDKNELCFAVVVVERPDPGFEALRRGMSLASYRKQMLDNI